MSFDAFTGGIEPGGLRTQSDIRLLICYLLASVKAPLSKNDIVSILQENGLANYFEAAHALSEMLDKGNADTLPGQPDCCVANDITREIAARLDSTLPPAVRDRAVDAALNLLARARRESQNKVEIRKRDDGYRVTCHISGGEQELMSFSLLVPDEYQARAVKRNFHHDPQYVYQVLLSVVTGNRDLLADLLRRL